MKRCSLGWSGESALDIVLVEFSNKPRSQTRDLGHLILTSPGDYTRGNLFADVANARLFIIPSQTDASLDANSSGSALIAEIPGLLLASSLAPGQTVSFDIDFEVPSTATSLGFNVFEATTPTPEPSSLLSTLPVMLN